mmetsp:Transcript_27047/g.62521  ORF Transcript_27047/g.62521 Transcript_27047/m.62521 type:complete len:1278 (+) Transcript_27047:121-3954(+)
MDNKEVEGLGGEAKATDAEKADVDAQQKAKAKEALKQVSYRKLFSLATTKEWLILHAGHVGAFGNGVAQPGLCLFFGDLIDAVAGEPDQLMDELEEAVMKMALVGVWAAVWSTLQLACFKIFADAQVNHFRKQYFDAVLHQDVQWFDTRDIASLATSMSGDAEKVMEGFSDKLGNAFMSWWAFIGGFICAFIIGWQVALMMLIILPLMMVGAVAMGTAIQEVQAETQGWYRKAAVVVEECLFAFRTVVAFGGERRELKTFENAVEQTRKGGVVNGFKLGASLGYTMWVVFLGYGLAFYWGAVLIEEGVDNPRTGEPWTAGNIVSVFFCVFIGSFYLGNVQPGISALTQAKGAYAAFFDAMQTPTIIEQRLKDTRAACPEIEQFEMSQVQFSYPARPEVPILRGLSLLIKKGQRVAVVGESGSGKSTVMALLERFYDPSSGVVTINSVDIKTFAVKSLRRRVGYVGQEPVLFATSIKDNILQGSLGAEPGDLDRVVADAELTFVSDLPEKLNTYVGSGGSQFSGGQKQRIAIARALIKKASVLFFDEATSALDNKSEKAIQATIDNIANKAGGNITTVSIAHRLTTIKNSDLIYVLSRGEVVESGNHQELVKREGTYFALAAAQNMAGEGEDGNEMKVTEVTEANAPEANTQPKQEAFGRQISDSTKSGQKDAEEIEKERQKQVAKEYKVPMARVLGYCKQEWPFFIPAILGAMLDGIAMPACAWVMIQGLDSFGKSPSQIKEDMEGVALLFTLVAFVDFAAATIQHGCFAILGEGMTKRLRVALLIQLFRQEIGFHDDPENTPAKLGKALELWSYRMSNLVRAFGGKGGAMTAIFFGLGMAFYYSWHMALGMLASIPVMVGTSMLQFMVTLGAGGGGNEGMQRAQQIVSDAVQNVRTCHASACEDELIMLYKQLVDKAEEGSIRKHTLSGLAFGLSTGTMFWVLAGGFYFAGWLVKEGEGTFIDTMTAFIGIFYAAMGAGQAAMTIGDANKAKVAAHDMFKLLDRESLIDSWEPKGETPAFNDKMAAGRIEFEQVSFTYPFRPDIQVLKGMSFIVEQGQSAGLVGPSGGGKSTVMAMIQRFYDPSAGALKIGPQRLPLVGINIRWWRTQLGFVGQEPILFNTTVRNNITYGLADGEKVSDSWMEKCAQMANLGFLDSETKRFDTEVGPRGSRLSGGQKQRVAICRALIRDPPVLLFDEATSALDTQSEQVVQRALEVAREGRTSFSIAHRLSTITDCQVILVVSAGLIVEQGNHEELLSMDGVYKKLLNAANTATTK